MTSLTNRFEIHDRHCMESSWVAALSLSAFTLIVSQRISVGVSS